MTLTKQPRFYPGLILCHNYITLTVNLSELIRVSHFFSQFNIYLIMYLHVFISCVYCVYCHLCTSEHWLREIKIYMTIYKLNRQNGA